MTNEARNPHDENMIVMLTIGQLAEALYYLRHQQYGVEDPVPWEEQDSQGTDYANARDVIRMATKSRLNPPSGWDGFGTHSDRPHIPLRWSPQRSEDGLPLWEQPR